MQSIVDRYKDQLIVMKGLNHFECPGLKLYGYGSVNHLKRSIDRVVCRKDRHDKYREREVWCE
jgi:hypothetical protein